MSNTYKKGLTNKEHWKIRNETKTKKSKLKEEKEKM